MELPRIWVRHPKTKAERTIWRAALGHYKSAGWEEFDPSAPPGGEAAEKTEAPGSPGLSHAAAEAPKRRSSTKES